MEARRTRSRLMSRMEVVVPLGSSVGSSFTAHSTGMSSPSLALIMSRVSTTTFRLPLRTVSTCSVLAMPKAADLPVPNLPRPGRPRTPLQVLAVHLKKVLEIRNRHTAAIVGDADALTARKDRHLNPRRDARIDVLQAVDDILPNDHCLIFERSGRGEKVAADVRGHLQLRSGGHAVASLLRSSIR